jgi:LacI family transcriptional regulator
MDTILFITDLHVGSHVPEFAGVYERASAHRWRVIELELARTVRPLGEVVAQWRPSGCILEGCNVSAADQRRTFSGIPVVNLDPDPETSAFAKHTVSSDPGKIAVWAAKELLRTNPASCVYFGWCTKTVWSLERGRIFRECAQRDSDKPFAEFGEDWEMGDTLGVQRRLADFLAPLPKPVGIFAANDYAAVQVTEACRRLGWECPRDFTLVGADNEVMHCECADPTITSIEQDFMEAGRLSADLLAELIENPRLPPRHLTFGPVRLVRRQSTRSLMFHDPRITRAVERIRRDATTGLTAADVLAEIPFSRRVAEKRFRAATGKTILEEIQDVRFEKVCELLSTDVPIGHIANRCGMQSDSFLKRFFKARTGMTLREWRNAHAASGRRLAPKPAL